MPYVRRKGTIYYEVEGEGPPLILQHGFTQDIEDWREFGWATALRQDYRLILINARGHGESEKSYNPEDYQLDSLAADVLSVLDSLGVEKAHFFGYSWGANIGCALVKLAPRRLWSLVLGGLYPYEDTGRADRAREQFGAGMAAYVRNDISPGLVITPEYSARRLALDPQALIAASLAHSQVDGLTQLAVPCLFFAGEASGEYQLIVEFADRFREARVLSLPGLGHGQCFRYGHLALPHIQQFLQQVTPRAERNRAVVQRVIRAVNSANYAALDDCYHPDWTWNGRENLKGADGARQLISQIFSAFSDAEVEIEEIEADRDEVATHWVFKAIHTGAWRGAAPSATRVRLSGITVDRLADSRIIQSHFRYEPTHLR